MSLFERARFAGDGLGIGPMGALHSHYVGVKWFSRPKGDAGWEWRGCDARPGRETRLEIDNRLDRLSQVNPAVCSVVEMRTFNEWNSPETVPRLAFSTW